MSRLATLLAAVSVSLVAAPTFADELRFVNNEIGTETVVSPSTTTRAQVVAELERAQRAGDLSSSYEFADPVEVSASTRSREQVQREAVRISDRERTAQGELYGPDA